jgi:hypothetical protein
MGQLVTNAAAMLEVIAAASHCSQSSSSSFSASLLSLLGIH